VSWYRAYPLGSTLIINQTGEIRKWLFLDQGVTTCNTVATVSVGWEPSEEANCPADQPISQCDIVPGQQNFTISIDLVQIA
jgi:hypothetical protein